MIEADVINAFIKPINNIFQKNIPESMPVSIDDYYLSQEKVSQFNVVVYCAIYGDYTGRIAMSLDVGTAKKITEILMKKKVDFFEQSFLDSVGELLNMIIGNAMIELNELHKNINISPPHLDLYSQFNLFVPECLESLTIPIATQLGNIDLDLVLIGSEYMTDTILI